MKTYKGYVQFSSILSFTIGLVLLIISGYNPPFTVSNLLAFFGLISGGVGFGIVIGAPNFRKQEVINK